MINTAIYIRVSTEDQAKDGFSIHAQREKLTKYAELNDWNIYDYYVDDGISGKNINGRPEVQRMLDDVKKGNVSNVLIYKLDRLTRSVRDLIDLIEFFEEYNCTFNSQTEKIDTSNAVGRMFVKIIGIFAEFERENLAERVSFGYEQKTREGNYTNTNGVYGYDYIVKEQKLIVNEEEKKLVNRIFDEYINGKSYFKIAKTLNNENIPTKRGGKWASSTIKSIINNPLYIGKVRYGVNKTKNKSFTVDSNIKPIVDIEKWELASRLVDTRNVYSVRRYPSENSYYFHIVKCGKCGGNIIARQQIQKGKLYITYKCKNSLTNLCNSSGFSHSSLDKLFEEYLEKCTDFVLDDSIFEHNKEKEKIKKDKKFLVKKIDQLMSRKKEIRNNFINKTLSMKDYKQIIEDIDYNISSFSKEIIKCDEIINQNIDKYIIDIKELVVNLKLNWINLTNFEKQRFLERFVDKIEVEKCIDSNLKIKSIMFKKLVNKL